MSASEKPPFDAAKHVRSIRTKQGPQDYLPAWARVLWLRHEHPTAQVVTEEILVTDVYARFKCTITLPNGAIATAHAAEFKSEFPDYLEKAETSALSRACAVLGYGTEGAHDLGDALREVPPPAQPERVSVSDVMIPAAQKWFATQFPRRGYLLPKKFERWGDVIGVLDKAGINYSSVVDDRGIDFAAIKTLVEKLPVTEKTAVPAES